MTELFLFAHLDDEAFGPAGTIAKHTYSGKDVVVVSLCSGRGLYGDIDQGRQEAFEESCSLLGATPRWFDNEDLFLTVESATDITEALMANYKPEVVYTHFIGDIHKDHRILAEAAMVACRPHPNSPVRELYMCEQAPATGWSFGQFAGLFEPDTYEDISGVILDKTDIMRLYGSELRDSPDARSISAAVSLSEYRGAQIGVKNAEAFKTVFRLR